MVFSSYVFILAFLPVVLLGYFLLSHLKNGIYQRLFLIAASLFFYGYYNVWYLLLIVASIAFNYLFARLIGRFPGKKAKTFLILGILFNVLLLGYFKYFDFFVENVNRITGANFALRHIVLPLGISFFTFQQLSFLVSVYRGEEEVGRLRDYCLFVTFFPQLVAGPIVLYSEMIPQFREEKRRYFQPESFAKGLYLFAFGLFKKAVLADTLAFLADNAFAIEAPGMAASWAAAICFSLQIFFDFSGYSDMAVGIGKMFNIDLPFNFLSPYRSESVSEFWRRWHVTLGRALKTFVYVPLGGNRRGKVRTSANLFLTFLISGIWHGASWTFVLWGALHGLFVVAERLIGEKLNRIPKFIRVIGTFFVVTVLWVLFRAENFHQAIAVYRGLVAFGNIGFSELNEVVGNAAFMNFPFAVDCVYLFGLLAISIFAIARCRNGREMAGSFRPNGRTLAVSVSFFAAALLCLTRQSVFLYFNF